MNTLRHPRRHRGNLPGADALYGVLYPADHLRLVGFYGDAENITRGILLFDRDVGAMPGDVNLWCGDRKAFYPELVDARKVRVSFHTPIYTSSAWSWDPSLGDFTGKDGCKYALAASGILQEAGGPHPAGKIWLTGITRYDSTNLDFTFSAAVTADGNYASQFWCLDELGNAQGGNNVQQPASETVRVTFNNNIAAQSQGGLTAGFQGVSEYADVLSPVTWRF